MNQDRSTIITNSQLKEGYKQTEVGIIPEDWEIATATQVCEIIIDCKNRTPPVIEGGEFAVVRTPNVRNGRFVYDDLRFTDESSFREWTARAIPQIGDILITREAPLGEVCLVPKELKVCLGQRMMLYRPDQSKIDSAFFLYSLMAPIVQKCLLKKIGGSTVGHAKVDDIRNVSIPLPPTKAEQEAIAHTLSDIDALIESLDRLLTKKRQIKQGAMQELLRSKDGWIEYPLSEICWFQEGPGVRNHQFTSTGVKLFNGTNIEKGKIDLDKTNRYISEREAFGWYSHFLADVDDIVIACSGISIDKFDEKVAVIDNRHLPLCMNTSTMRFKVKQEILDKYYLLHFLRSSSFKNQIGGTATGSAQLNFGPSHVSVVKIQLPELSEQIEIANILSDMDAEIGSIESKLAKTRQLKQGMMHELLTGRIRLV
jgi:type I restriction enzyme, S subunit